MKELLTVSEVAEVLSISKKTLWAWLDAGKIPGVRLGRCLRIKRSDLDKLVQDSYTPARRSHVPAPLEIDDEMLNS